MVHMLPYVYRANSMAKALNKDVSFEIVLLPPETKGIANGVTEVSVMNRELAMNLHCFADLGESKGWSKRTSLG